MAALNTGVSYEFETPRSSGSIDVMKRVATHDAYRVTNQLRMASRRVLEWIGMFKGLAGILHVHVHVDMNYLTCFKVI